MILENLTVNNFRVFEGEHTFDLIPRVKYKKKRPIILFGGLNGAGKTTTLTAVRLGLYGKQSLSSNASIKDYEEYLSKSIHRSKHRTVQPNTASIDLAFSYASMGVVKHYLIKRNWQQKGKGIKENLSITEDGNLLSELSNEQCQGFLNELIPIGVSDLFFFDGEKIAELAEDTKGEALGDSIKKLLGLDLLETLDADLGILLRNETKKGFSTEKQKMIKNLESELEFLEHQAEKELDLYQQAKPQEIEAQEKIEKLEARLSSRGGAWAASREKEIKNQTKLAEEKRLIEESIREVISGSYPISLASGFVTKTLDQLKSEAKSKHSSKVSELVQNRIDILKKRLSSILKKEELKRVCIEIEDEFKDVTKHKGKTVILHDISDRLLGTIEATIKNALTKQSRKIIALRSRLEKVNENLDKAGKNISRAPEEAQIKPTLDKISKTYESISESKGKQKVHIENHKRLLREAIAVARKLDKESSNYISDEEKSRTHRYACSARTLLKDFTTEIAKRKVADLESEFQTSFHRLARKEDVDLHASIDPVTFTVTLLRGDGIEVDKDELSAGEKQIYAISILEALARTSGRNLPIIIDTPLGRLDSVHRTNLINHYFPTASHQVIILSTDTEVDESFYSDLSPSISHAFKLEYAHNSGSTIASEGYFWREGKTTKKEVSHAT